MARYVMVYLFYVIQSLLLQGSFRLCSVWATTNKAAGNVLKHESIHVITYLCRIDLHRVELLGQKYLIDFNMLLSQKIITVLFSLYLYIAMAFEFHILCVSLLTKLSVDFLAWHSGSLATYFFC